MSKVMRKLLERDSAIEVVTLTASSGSDYTEEGENWHAQIHCAGAKQIAFQLTLALSA
jgi:hypothetical protein